MNIKYEAFAWLSLILSRHFRIVMFGLLFSILFFAPSSFSFAISWAISVLDESAEVIRAFTFARLDRDSLRRE